MKRIATLFATILFMTCAGAATTIPSSLINWITPPSAPSQTAKFVFSAPNASAGVPTFRQLLNSDISGLGTSATVNTGTSGATIPLLSTANTWTLTQAFTVRPTFNGNTPYDTGNLTIASYLTTATAASTYATIAQATTALAATGGSINGIPVGATTPSTGAFTTLVASGNDALTYQNTSGQSIPNNAFTTVTGWTKLFDRVNANFNAATGVFTAPAIGIYQVSAALGYVNSVSGAVNNQYGIGISANGTVQCYSAFIAQITATTDHLTTVSCLVSVSAGQTIVIQAFQNSGAAIPLGATARNNYVSINRVP
jgi:hypothetical protein